MAWNFDENALFHGGLLGQSENSSVAAFHASESI